MRLEDLPSDLQDANARLLELTRQHRLATHPVMISNLGRRIRDTRRLIVWLRSTGQ